MEGGQTEEGWGMMGMSQSTELKDGANVKEIIGSESRYSVFDLSAWQGSSVVTLMLLLTLIVGGLLSHVRNISH